jgi:hypothetical protein
MSQTENNYGQPLLFNKDLGRPLPLNDDIFPQTNADGKPVIPLTQEQKYIFDSKGWLLIPGVLEESEIEEMRDFSYRLRYEPDSIAPHERSTYGGPLQALTDHPVVVGFANEFLANPYLSSQECYGFRMEMSFPALRSAEDEPFAFHPHNGNAMFRLPGDAHEYHCIPGKAFSGLTRVVWELNPVEKGDGGTLFITASHKSAYAAPESAYELNSPLWDTYSCPAGSVVIFTEAITHSGQPWVNKEYDRVAVFNAYHAVDRRWTKSRPNQTLLESMPPLRQTLFRDAYIKGNLVGRDFGALYSA